MHSSTPVTNVEQARQELELVLAWCESSEVDPQIAILIRRCLLRLAASPSIPASVSRH